MAFRGGGGGIDRITSSGGTITITSPVGPVTNLEGASQAVSSVFGRTGAVVAATNDYTAAQVTNAASLIASNTFTQSMNVQGSLAAKSASSFAIGFGDYVVANRGGINIAGRTNLYESANNVWTSDSRMVMPGIAANPITSGALPTVSPSSGTAFQCSTIRDVFLCLTITYTLIASTCKVELSPDNSTFSTLGTYDPGVAGAVDPINLAVPAGWWVKVTLSNASVTAATYY